MRPPRTSIARRLLHRGTPPTRAPHLQGTTHDCDCETSRHPRPWTPTWAQRTCPLPLACAPPPAGQGIWRASPLLGPANVSATSRPTPPGRTTPARATGPVCLFLPDIARGRRGFRREDLFCFFGVRVSQSTCSTAALPWRASRAIGPGAPASGVGADAVDTRPPLLGQLVAAWAAERVSDGDTQGHTSTRRVVSLATLHRESPPICRCRASRVANAPAPLLAFPPPSPRSARSSRRLPLPSVGPLPIFGESADDVPYEFCFTEI